MRYIKCTRCLHPRAIPWPIPSSQSDRLPLRSAKSTLITNHLLQLSTTHADAGTMCPTTAGPTLRTVRIGPITFSPAARLSVVEHPNPARISGRGSFITRIEDPRAQSMHSQRSSWKRARECDVACNALRLAMNSASNQYTFHVHFLCVKVGNASSIIELSAIRQARAMCSRRRKDVLHHNGWITPAARCVLNSRALN